MREASIETEISPKAEEKETAPTGLQSMHGREGGKFDKKKMTRFEARARNSSQMGLRPKMKINTIARTKFGVYTQDILFSTTYVVFDPNKQAIKEKMIKLFRFKS